jgi:hypothetical protein
VLQLRIAGLLCVVVPALSLAEPGDATAKGDPPAAPSTRSLEERVSGAKQRILRSKVRLTGLQERAGGGEANGSRPAAPRADAPRQPAAAASEGPRK